MSAISQSFRLTHDLIAKFLASNGYSEALEAFYKEGGDFVSLTKDEAMGPADGDNKPLIEIVAEYYIAEKFVDRLNTSLDELIVDDGSENTWNPTEVIETKAIDTLHNGNILCIRAIDPITELVDSSHVGLIVTSSTDKTIKVSSITTGNFVTSIDDAHKGGSVLCIDQHPTLSNIILTSSMDYTVALTDIVTNQSIQLWDHHSKFVTQAKFSPDGTSFVSGSHDHTLSIYRSKSKEEQVAFELVRTLEFQGNVEAACYTPDSKWVIVAVREDNYLHYIDPNSFAITKLNMNQNGDDVVSFTVMDLAISPSGTHVLAATDHRSGRVILFKLHSSTIVRDFYGVPQDEFSTPKLAWHPAGRYFFVTGDDFKIHIFDVKTCKRVAGLAGHAGVIRTLCIDQRSKQLISGSFDRTIRYWSPL